MVGRRAAELHHPPALDPGAAEAEPVLPAVVLVVLLTGNLLFTPDFFAIRIRDGHLYGSLIDVLRASTPLVLVALGMTVVIATGASICRWGR